MLFIYAVHTSTDTSSLFILINRTINCKIYIYIYIHILVISKKVSQVWCRQQ